MERFNNSEDTFGQILSALGVCFFIMFVGVVLSNTNMQIAQTTPTTAIAEAATPPVVPAEVVADDAPAATEELAAHNPAIDTSDEVDGSFSHETPEVLAMLKADQEAYEKHAAELAENLETAHIEENPQVDVVPETEAAPAQTATNKNILDETESAVVTTFGGGRFAEASEVSLPQVKEVTVPDVAVVEETPQVMEVAFNDRPFETVKKVSALTKEMAVQEEPPLPQEVTPPQVRETVEVTSEHGVCEVNDLGVKFKCDQKWPKVEANDGEGSLVLSSDPLVTLNWGKVKDNIQFLGQINKFFFEEMGRYQSGFIMENVRFAGYNAIAIKGFDKNEPNTQRRDYFYLYNKQLVDISFKVATIEKIDEGKSIVQEVASTFSPIH